MRRVVIVAGLAAVIAAPLAHAHRADAPVANVERPAFAQRPVPMPAQMPAEPPATATPKARCGPGANPEPGIQGRVSAEDVASGRAEKGFWCNLRQIGHSGRSGGYKALRYIDKAGHECAYYDTTLLFPVNAINLSGEPTGVAVLDMSDPAKPVRTDSLLTPAMQTPHESVNISVERGLLAAVTGNPAAYPGIVDVYALEPDCRRPLLRASVPAAIFGHESGMAPDGMTFYPTSIGTGQTTAVDISNPRLPIRLWQGEYNSHGMTVSDDGNRGYLAAGDGLIILDLSEIQARKPNPQVREVSRLVWSNMTIPQIAIPVTINGKPYIVEVDEFAQNANGDTIAHGDVVGAARIIDLSDERKPFVVSNIRLEVHQPEHRPAIADDPGAQFVVQGYAGHYCNVPRRKEPGIFACSFINSGLRVFDIRDPKAPKEIAYFVAPPGTKGPSGEETDTIDERANHAMSQPAFAPERGEIWYTDGSTGFYALKVDPDVWPFPKASGGPAACADNRGLRSVSAGRAGRAVRLDFKRRVNLPVRVDVFRVSQGRRVVGERLVARFRNRRSGVLWRPRAGAGYYFVRFTMLKDGKAYDTRRVVLQRRADGAIARRPDHFRRDSCGLLGKFKLERPVFGGPGNAPLRAAYRLTAAAKVTVTVSRGKKVVKRFATVDRAAQRTFRVSLPSKGLPEGDYTLRLHAVSGEDQVSAALTARRI